MALGGTSATAWADDAIVVTATRTARSVDDTLAPVTVITREDIERLQPATLPDLLVGQPGVDLVANGGFGKNTSVFLRGTNSNQTLVLIDGVRVGSATTGAAALQYIPPEQIDRIEIVRGPRAGLYGADAIGGVIHIFTRRGQGDPRFNFTGSVGSDTTRAGSVGLSGSSGGTRYAVQAAYFGTEGYNVQLDGATTPFGFTPDEPDDDGYRNGSVGGSLSHRFNSGLELGVNALRAAGQTEYDGVPNETDFVQQVLGAYAAMPVLAGWFSRLSVNESRDDSDNLFNDEVQTLFDSQRRQMTWQNDVSIGEAQLLTLGVDYVSDEVVSTTEFAETERDNVGYFIQDQIRLGRHDIVGSLRYDDNDAYGENTTGGLTWGVDLSDAARVTASYGRAFRAPTFNELFFPDVGFFAGNPDLAPEESENLELGIQMRTGPARVQASVFRNTIDDLIVFDSGAGTVGNIESARVVGLETGIELNAADWRLYGAVTVLDHENRDTGADLPRRANESARIELDRSWGALSMGGTVIAQGRRYDDAANTVELPGYGLVNFRAGLEIADGWSVQGRIDNVFDKQYSLADTYLQPGRAAYVSVNYRTP